MNEELTALLATQLWWEPDPFTWPGQKMGWWRGNSFQNVWTEKPGMTARCIYCGEVVDSVTGVKNHLCPKSEEAWGEAAKSFTDNPPPLPLVPSGFEFNAATLPKSEWRELPKYKVIYCAWCPDPRNPSPEHHLGGQARHDLHPPSEEAKHHVVEDAKPAKDLEEIKEALVPTDWLQKRMDAGLPIDEGECISVAGSHYKPGREVNHFGTWWEVKEGVKCRRCLEVVNFNAMAMRRHTQKCLLVNSKDKTKTTDEGRYE